MKIIVYKNAAFQFTSRYVNGHFFLFLILFTIVGFQYIATLRVLWSEGYHKISIVFLVGMPSKCKYNPLTIKYNMEIKIANFILLYFGICNVCIGLRENNND